MSAARSTSRKYELLPGENENIEVEIRELLKNADEWLDAPNDKLSGERPWDLIGTDKEPLLRNLVRSARFGVGGQ